MKKIMTLLLALMMSAALYAQEIEKVDKFPSGYINGVYMGEAKYKTIDGVLYAVGYEGTKDWILVRYPAGCKNDTYTVHPYCRRIARGAFEGAAYLPSICQRQSVISAMMPLRVASLFKAFLSVTPALPPVALKPTRAAMLRKWRAIISLVVPAIPTTRAYKSSSTQTTAPKPSLSIKR